MSLRIVVKFGGSLAQDESVLKELTAAVADLARAGHRIVLVHGGGKDINANLELLQEEVRFENGLRVTDAPVLDMVEMTLSGRVNKKLVRLLTTHSCRAVGISGVDGLLLEAAPMTNADVDLGYVGEIADVRPRLIEDLWAGGWVPVVSPISGDIDGQAWNVNADHAASAIAASLEVDVLLFLSDVPGVLEKKEVIPELNDDSVHAKIASGVIQGGMIPKTHSALQSVEAGVKAVHIVGWKSAEDLEKQLLGEHNYGTIIH
jgi:acetylglutamate kinase